MQKQRQGTHFRPQPHTARPSDAPASHLPQIHSTQSPCSTCCYAPATAAVPLPLPLLLPLLPPLLDALLPLLLLLLRMPLPPLLPLLLLILPPLLPLLLPGHAPWDDEALVCGLVDDQHVEQVLACRNTRTQHTTARHTSQKQQAGCVA